MNYENSCICIIFIFYYSSYKIIYSTVRGRKKEQRQNKDKIEFKANIIYQPVRPGDG